MMKSDSTPWEHLNTKDYLALGEWMRQKHPDAAFKNAKLYTELRLEGMKELGLPTAESASEEYLRGAQAEAAARVRELQIAREWDPPATTLYPNDGETDYRRVQDARHYVAPERGGAAADQLRRELEKNGLVGPWER